MQDEPMERIFPTWGYKPDGSAQIFDLKEEDEDLPEGWSRQLDPRNHPNTAHLYAKEEYVTGPQGHEPKKRGRPSRQPEID